MADLYDLGDRPALGVVPPRMHAFLVRQNRFGQPRDAWKREVIPTPSIGPDEVLVYVMASGINYNNVWAALGTPVDVIAERQRQGEPEDFHAGGSDCSGIVWAVGKDVKNVKVGDEVIIHSGWWRPDDPWVLSGKDPMLAESTRIWGYQTNYGSYCQFARAQSHQCLPKPKRLTWEESGCFLLCASTAYRMLMGWAPNIVESGDVVLVWGAAGGLGSVALDIVRAQGGRAVAVISDEAKRKFCLEHGAAGVVNRTEFSHWGPMPDTKDAKAYGEWAKGARAFGKAIWDALGDRISPRIVFEHPGESTLPTSGFVCATGGMIVICAGTTGLQRDDGSPLPLDAPEALPGQPSLQRRAGCRRDGAGSSRKSGSLSVEDVPLRRHPGVPSTHAGQPAPLRQHGGAGQRHEGGPRRLVVEDRETPRNWRFERRLCRRNLSWGEVRKGASPLRVQYQRGSPGRTATRRPSTARILGRIVGTDRPRSDATISLAVAPAFAAPMISRFFIVGARNEIS
jgi:crotonyl-CoA carboxylase/reductase